VTVLPVDPAAVAAVIIDLTLVQLQAQVKVEQEIHHLQLRLKETTVATVVQQVSIKDNQLDQLAAAAAALGLSGKLRQITLAEMVELVLQAIL
jgi:hypothetical protein